MAPSTLWHGSMLHAILPSFIADVVFPEHKSKWKLHPTSYLDGLRGLASIIVFICHYTEENHAYLIAPYGLNFDKTPSSWIQLPYLRIIFSGRPMVHIFFIISGFVLSYKPIKTIHAGQLDKCFATLSSSAFRRPIRLFGPCLVSTFVIMLFIQAGWMYTPTKTFNEQFWLWFYAMFHSITWPWEWDRDLRPGYDVHLWTIPIEFVHSMLLFMVVLVLSRVRLLVRQSAILALMMYCLACGKWAAFEFLGGMFLAEVHLLQASSASKVWESSDSAAEPMLYSPQKRAVRHTLHNVFHLSILAAALFVGGWPNFDAIKTPGIRWLLVRTPDPFAHMDELAPQKFWFALSAAFVVWSCGELAYVRRFLENGLSQYCGRVSYAVYICHGPVLNMFQDFVVGNVLVPAVGEPSLPDYKPPKHPRGVKGMLGVDTPFQRTACWFFGLAVLGPMVIWAADLFWRAVDNPIIALARRAENAVLDDPYQQHSERPSTRGTQGYSASA